MKRFDKVVPDTSIIIERIVSRELEAGELEFKEIIIHEAVLAELESQANKGRETGTIGLEEIASIRKLSEKSGFKIQYKGKRPGDFEIKFAKSGEIDSLIRDLAFSEKATLITADIVQSKVAEAKGIPVVLYEFRKKDEDPLSIEKYFDAHTMSLHLKEDAHAYAKKGSPGSWSYEKVTDEAVTHEQMEEFAKDIVEKAKLRADGFVESERKGSTIIQIGAYRILIVRPPLSDGHEITAIKHIKSFNLEHYKLTDKLQERVWSEAEGILIAGAPGHGKSTFLQALAFAHLEKSHNVKTIESPRDLQLPVAVTQYGLDQAPHQEIRDILLLSRPDCVLFDEIRNPEDFRLFADLRLSGIGMIGVVHAKEPIDSVQRLIGRVELGMIPGVVDTVIFIRNGSIGKVLSLQLEIKVPLGMTEADLARPVVSVYDFDSERLEYEIYSYGEETVVVPARQASSSSPLQEMARKHLAEELRKYEEKAIVEIINERKILVRIPEESKGKFIGKDGANIERLERKLGLSIEVAGLKAQREGSDAKFNMQVTAKDIIITLEPGSEEKSVNIYVDSEFLLSAKASKKAEIKMSRTSPLAKLLVDAHEKGKEITVKT